MNYAEYLNEEQFVIFLFHGVINKCNYEIRNYTRKHVERDYFQIVLKELKASGNPVSLEDVLNYHNEKRQLPPKSFAITFDDGFENNVSVAAPILADMEIPATFYLTTSFVENNSMSWIDQLELLFEEVSTGKVDIEKYKISFVFNSKGDRIKILDFLRNTAKKDESVDLDILVRDIYSQFARSAINIGMDQLDKKMTWDQVRELSSEKLFTIGGHTHTHANLAFLTDDCLNEEISTSIKLLYDRAHLKVKHYSYPEGLDYCFSPKVISALKTFDIKCCPTAIQGVNRNGDDLFTLKRIQVI